MHDSHDAIVSGHLGVATTIDRLSRNFTWPSMLDEFSVALGIELA
jgi:Integrase zinc binding domain